MVRSCMTHSGVVSYRICGLILSPGLCWGGRERAEGRKRKRKRSSHWILFLWLGAEVDVSVNHTFRDRWSSWTTISPSRVISWACESFQHCVLMNHQPCNKWRVQLGRTSVVGLWWRDGENTCSYRLEKQLRPHCCFNTSLHFPVTELILNTCFN